MILKYLYFKLRKKISAIIDLFLSFPEIDKRAIWYFLIESNNVSSDILKDSKNSTFFEGKYFSILTGTDLDLNTSILFWVLYKNIKLNNNKIYWIHQLFPNKNFNFKINIIKLWYS